MKFFNLDCHVSVIADIKQIFESLGHEVVSWSISGHNWVFDRNSDPVEIINQNTWRNLDEDLCNKFYNRYRDFLSQFDGFICTYPLTFSLLYEKFEKPIILHIPIRYEVPYQNSKEKWTKFNEFIKKGIENKKIYPVANSMYDKKYFEFFIKKNCDYIPNICNYTNTIWSPESEKFLWYSKLTPPSLDFPITNIYSIGRYKWTDITKYKGIVTIPYNSSTMSLFEFYNSNIPLFCPNIDFMMELYKNKNVLSDLTWNRIYNMQPKSVIDCDVSRDPNNFSDIKIMKDWIKYSDFYNDEWMPYITYFDSFDDLNKKIFQTDIFHVNKMMNEFNKKRRYDIVKLWDNKIKEIYE